MVPFSMVFGAAVVGAAVESPCENAVPGSAAIAIKPSPATERKDVAAECCNRNGERTSDRRMRLPSRGHANAEIRESRL